MPSNSKIEDPLSDDEEIFIKKKSKGSKPFEPKIAETELSGERSVKMGWFCETDDKPNLQQNV